MVHKRYKLQFKVSTKDAILLTYRTLNILHGSAIASIHISVFSGLNLLLLQSMVKLQQVEDS